MNPPTKGDEFWLFMENRSKDRRGSYFVKPKPSDRLRKEAKEAANLHQDRNPTDLHAYGRAFNAVWNGIFTVYDFREANISC